MILLQSNGLSLSSENKTNETQKKEYGQKIGFHIVMCLDFCQI